MKKLNERSKQIRRDVLKLSKANGGYHYGGSFSIVEILIALYDYVLTHADKFILSKGHACWPYYVILRELGMRPKLGGHPCLDEKNGIYFTTGSEGHGFPAAIGMALARKMKGDTGKIYVLIGDGECQEGTTWESLLMAAHHKLDNLIVIVDWNLLQGAGVVKDTLSIDGLGEIVKILGWSMIMIDGHDIDEIHNALNYFENDKPLLIIAHTTKGRGVSYMENKKEWHAKWPDKEHEKQAFEDLK